MLNKISSFICPKENLRGSSTWMDGFWMGEYHSLHAGLYLGLMCFPYQPFSFHSSRLKCCWNSSSSLIAPIGNTGYPTYHRAVHVFQLSIGNPSPSTALDCMLLVEVFPMHPSVILHATLPTTHRGSHVDIPTITGKIQRKKPCLIRDSNPRPLGFQSASLPLSH